MSYDEQDTAIVESNGHKSASNVFDVLRAKRAEHDAERTYDIDVPGYGGLLLLRCGPPSSQHVARLRARYERSKSADRDYELAADILIAACREVLWRETPQSELTPIVVDDEAVALDERLAEGLSLQADTARAVVRELFGVMPSPELAVGSEVGALMEWATSVNAELDSAFVGESPAAPR